MRTPAGESTVEVWAVGVVPPPVTGMTVLTKRVIDELRSTGPITFCNWSAQTSQRGLTPFLRRALGMLKAVFRLIGAGRKSNASLYLVANSDGALPFTSLLAYTGVRLGYRLYLHHHTYAYIDCWNRWMAKIVRWMNADAIHIVHCQNMIDDFQKTYGSNSRFFVLHPSIVSLPLGKARNIDQRPFRLGHLSNLTLQKGLDTVIATFEKLRTEGQRVRLVLAGPLQSGESRRLVDQATNSNPDSVQYLGPLYGEEKKRFFEGIDAFLLPTRSESWGIVLNEALAAGAPVITLCRGCTPCVVGDGGLVVGEESHFVDAACQTIRKWIACPDEHFRASQAALEQAEHLHTVGDEQLAQLMEMVFSPQQRVAGLEQLVI